MTASTRLSVTGACFLSTEALAALRALVVAQLHASAEQAAAHDQTARELAGQTDPDSVIERELAEACAARARAAVADARLALNRFEAGTYGACEACGRPIPFERLEAIPQARRCVACPPHRSGVPAAWDMPGGANRAVLWRVLIELPQGRTHGPRAQVRPSTAEPSTRKSAPS